LLNMLGFVYSIYDTGMYDKQIAIFDIIFSTLKP
jgi:hypothetical protein